MFLRHGIVITREGWYFIFVALFILGGAVLRDVNLLVILGGMMVGPLLFSWRLARFGFRRLVLERRLPPRVVANEPFTVEVVVRSERRHYDSWGLLITDVIHRVGERQGGKSRAEVLIPHLPALAQRRGTYRVSLPRRGRYALGPAIISTRLPLGLLRVWERFAQTDSLVALPRQGRLSREWALRVVGEGIAGKISQRHGMMGGDYYGIREWRTGDSRRWIHWRTSAKLGAPAVLQFEQPHRHQVAMYVELWTPPVAGDRERGLAELAVSLAATAVADLGRRGGSQLNCYVHGTPPYGWSGPASMRSCESILERLALVAPTSASLDSEGLREVCRGLTSQETLVVISTRPSPADPARWLTEQGLGGRILWIDVGAAELAQYFDI